MSLEESIDGLASSINALAMAITASREAETVVVKAPVTEKKKVEPDVALLSEKSKKAPKKTKAPKKEEPVVEDAEVLEEPVAGTEWTLKALQQRTLEVFKVNAEAVMQALKDRKAAKVQFLPQDQWGDFANDLTKIEDQANG